MITIINYDRTTFIVQATGFTYRKKYLGNNDPWEVFSRVITYLVIPTNVIVCWKGRSIGDNQKKRFYDIDSRMTRTCDQLKREVPEFTFDLKKNLSKNEEELVALPIEA